MTLTINLPQDLESRLQREARAHELSMEEYALNLLGDALETETFLTPEEVVAKIKAIPPDPHYIRPASGSLAEALRDAPRDSDIDLAEWQKNWDAVEAEMNRVTRENDIAEGRG